MTFEGELTKKEFLKIQKALLPRLLRVMPWLMLSAFVTLALQGGLQTVLAAPVNQFPRLLLGVGFMLFFFVAPSYAIRKAWRTNAGNRALVAGELTSEGIEWRNPNVHARYRWEEIRGYRSTGGALLIYPTQNSFLSLLPRFFSDPEAWERANELVRAKVEKV